MNTSALGGRPLRLLSVLACGAGVALVLGAAASPSSRDSWAGTRVRAGTSSSSWGRAREVAGGLNAGGNAVINTVSCAAAGSCGAGGSYADNSGRIQAFAVDEANGRWRQAKEVAANLNSGVGNGAAVNSMSCAAAGSCSAGGFYTSTAGPVEAFVVNEVNGTWRPARTVAASLNGGGDAEITSVSCAAAGNCTAAGAYIDSSGNVQAFAVIEVSGMWRTATEVAAALNTGGFAEITSVSCAAAGNCSAGGFYHSSGQQQAFVVNETNGSWGRAAEVAANLNTGGGAAVNSVSCAAPGNCSAGGYYTAGPAGEAFAVNETDGSWGRAAEVAANLNTGAEAGIHSVSCAAAGNCSAGGAYTDSSGHVQAFAANETNGTWGRAAEVAASLNTGAEAAVYSVSCAAAGNCSAGGHYTGGSAGEAFVVNETNGTWGRATEVAANLNTGREAVVTSVSCAAAGNCSAGGQYADSSHHFQAFVVSKP